MRRVRFAATARWLAVFGLLLHMAVPMAHTPPDLTPAPVMARHAMDASGHHGAHAATDHDAPAPKPTKPGHDRPMQCPICQALQSDGPAPVPIVFAFAAPDTIRARYETAVLQNVGELSASLLQARAPPVAG